MEGSPDAQTLASGRLALKSGPPAEHGDRLVEAAGVEPASENVTGQETTCLFQFMPWALPQDVRDGCSERTRNSRR